MRLIVRQAAPLMRYRNARLHIWKRRKPSYNIGIQLVPAKLLNNRSFRLESLKKNHYGYGYLLIIPHRMDALFTTHL